MELTETGINAAAEELYHQASRGRQWNQASREVRDELRGVVRHMMDKAYGAEVERQSRERANRKGVLP